MVSAAHQRDLPDRMATIAPFISRWCYVAIIQTCEAVAIFGSAFAALASARYRNEFAGPGGWTCAGVAVILAVVVQRVFQSIDLYRFELITRNIKSALVAMGAWSVATGPLFVFAIIRNPMGQYARAWVLIWFALGAISIVLLRLFAALAGRYLIHKRQLGHSVCVIGNSYEAQTCQWEAERDRGGVVMLGYFCPVGEIVRKVASASHLGALTDLPEFIRCHRVDEIVVATTRPDRRDLAALIETLRCLPARVMLSPNVVGLMPTWLIKGDGHLGRLPLFQVNNIALEGWRWVVKDVQDRFLALLLLVASAPIFVATAIGIRKASPGPVFFRQTREGYGGREFRIFKFRTMHLTDSAETDRLQLATRDDPRVFPLGAVLRKTSLDELPQLLNVLLGDMWLIGPRPHSPLAMAAEKRYSEVVTDYSSRYRMKPGITGWAQVNGWRGPTDTVEQIEQRVRHDLYYIENWSVLFDLWILVKTGWSGFVHRNAF